MTKKTKLRVRRYPHELRGLTDRINKRQRQTVERLPDPISAHADAVVTMVGTNFSDYSSWGTAIRLVLIIPPTFPEATPTEVFSLGDCLTWLEGISRSLAIRLVEPGTSKLYRMVGALEGSPNRGWFYTVIVDLPKTAFSLERLKEIILSSKPERFCLIYVAECDGVIEASHIVGRLGLAYLTEGNVT